MTAAPDAIAERTAPAVARAIHALWVARLTGIGVAAARRQLIEAAGKPLALANILGRVELLNALRAAEGGRGGRRFSRIDNLGIAPRFWDAVEALLSRNALLAPLAGSISDIVEKGGIAFANAADEQVTARARDAIASSIAQGMGQQEAVRRLRESTSWSDAYAQTAYRTVALTSYSDGLKRQAADPRLGGAIAGWRYSATLDRDTRPNHGACDGVVAALDDPVWEIITPPLGFNCRCALIPIARQEAERRWPGGVIPPARIPSGGGPDPGFRSGA